MGVEYRISDVKWSTFEDDVNAMLGCNFQSRGVKRKLEAEKSEDEEKQKQLIFATSLEKLNKFRKIPDACLLQSVLVCNTIRRIKKQLDQEELNSIYNSNLMYTLNADSVLMPDPPDCSSVTAAMLPSVNTEFSKENVPSPLGINDNNTNSEYDRYLHEFDNSGRMTPFLRTAQNKTDQCALSYEESDRLQNLNWCSVLNFTNFENSSSNVNIISANSTDHDSDYSSSNTIDHDYLFGEISPSLHTLMPPTTTSVTNSSPLPSIMLSFPSLTTVTSNTTASIPTSSVLSSDTSNDDDEIAFGDIDLALYDYDLVPPLSPPMAAATDDDLMTSISDYDDDDEDEEDEEEEESL